MTDLNISQASTTVIQEDNQSVIAMAKNPVGKNKTYQEAVHAGTIKLEYYQTNQMIADIHCRGIIL